VKPGPSELQQQAFKAHQRLLRINCSQVVRDSALQTKERRDEFWYFGEEIEAYRKLLLQVPDPAHQAAVDDAHRLVVIAHDDRAVVELIDRFAALAR
jgi:hypothetical protein